MARMPCRPRVASLILCVTGLSAVTLLSGMPFAASAVAAESPPPTPRVEPEVGAADPYVITPERWLVSHRGGPRRFPEEGMRGYDASAASGFALEADARQLGDGTWVLLHDATVDRTMTGVTGAVDGLTLAQWQTARLRPAPSGRYPDDPAVTVVDFLQRQAGKVPILLELKAGDADGFVETVRAAAGAELPSVMVQSFDFAVAQRFGDAGLTPMFLMGAQIYPTVETIIGAGIRYVGVARSMDAASVAQLRAAGLVVVSYTVSTGVDLDIEFREGVHGVFTDDPWRMAVEGAFTPVSATSSRAQPQAGTSSAATASPIAAATTALVTPSTTADSEPAGTGPITTTTTTEARPAKATTLTGSARSAQSTQPAHSAPVARWGTVGGLEPAALIRLTAMVWGSTDPGLLVDGAATWSEHRPAEQ